MSAKVALVSGGGTGLGREIALALARHGCDVAIGYSVSEAEAIATVKELQALGVRAIATRADIANAAEVKAMVDETVAVLGRLDYLVCNAATTVFKPFSDLEGVTEADFDRIFAVNVKGTWLQVKAAVPHMAKQGGGSIVTISSVAGLRPAGSSLPYSVSKAAVIHLTRGLALAVAEHKIRVNSVAPGLLDTRWIANFPQSQRTALLNRSPLKAMPTLQDTVNAAILLLEGDTFTGEVLVCDAGASLL